MFFNKNSNLSFILSRIYLFMHKKPYLCFTGHYRLIFCIVLCCIAHRYLNLSVFLEVVSLAAYHARASMLFKEFFILHQTRSKTHFYKERHDDDVILIFPHDYEILSSFIG